MRPLEFLFLLGLLLSLLSLVAGKPRERRWLLPAVSFVLLLAHVAMEGARWQLYPAYFLSLVAIFYGLRPPAPGGPSWITRGTLVLAALLVAVSGFLAYALPVASLPAPGVPVGTFTLHLTDDARGEPYTAAPDDAREIMVQFWYPTTAQAIVGKDPEPWFPDVAALGPAIAREIGSSKNQTFPSFIFDHLMLTDSNAYAGVPVDTGVGETLPVVVYSHGWTGFRNVATNEMERLAAAGFIVAAPDHTYGAMGVVFPDGRVVLNKPDALPPKGADNRQPGIELLVDTYAGDVKLVLDTLSQLHAGDTKSPLEGKVDLQRIGIFGHSTGGGAVIEVAKTDDRVKALAGLDFWCEPVSLPLRTRSLAIPTLSIRSQGWYDDTRGDNHPVLQRVLGSFKGPLYDYYLADSKHADFTLMPLLSPFAGRLGRTGPIDPQLALDAVDESLIAFFQRYLNDDASAWPESGTPHPALRASAHPLK